jgi:hypothetical protein
MPAGSPWLSPLDLRMTDRRHWTRARPLGRNASLVGWAGTPRPGGTWAKWAPTVRQLSFMKGAGVDARCGRYPRLARTPRSVDHRLLIHFIFADSALSACLVRPHHGINGGAQEAP